VDARTVCGQRGDRVTVTKTFVHKLRKQARREQNDVVADHMVNVVRLMQANDYNGAVSYAKEHGFDLEALHYAESSGVLASTWPRMMQSIRQWGTMPRFLGMEKPMGLAPDFVGVPARTKFEADTPYRR
jgi:hypothetical protein